MTDVSRDSNPRVRLTSLSHGAGCACKLGPSELAQVLRHVPLIEDARVMVDQSTRDDAAVFRLSDDRAIVATLDFFAPIVDDPYAFGVIAATNALSDLYAMGATPLMTLNIVAWPRDPSMFALLGETLRGGADTARRAGVAVVGGHSVDDPEPKYGMVALGEVSPDKVITNAGARPGDRLVLTKPIGTGVLSTALKRGVLNEDRLAPAIESMSTLNAGGLRAMRAVGAAVHAATDVTGFGLLGHLYNMLAASKVGATIDAGRIPLFAEVRELAARGVVPSGTRRNLESVEPNARWGAGVTETDRLILADAQTSGGLLIAVHPDHEADLIAALRREKTLVQATVGTITADLPPGVVEVSGGKS